GGDGGYALAVDVVEPDVGPVGEGGDDRGLGGGVVAVDVGGRVGFGVSQRLGFGQHVVVGGPLLGHLGEDVVGGPVEDAHHPEYLLAGQRLAQRPDERDPAGDRRLEEQVHARVVGDGEQFRAGGGQQRLVAGDHRLAVGHRFLDEGAGRVEAAHQ